MPPPGFSIVVPSYQRRDLVCRNVAALDRIGYAGPFEVIVVVDGSTDGTTQALRDLSLRVPLKVVEQTNRGQASARNLGAVHAAHEIVLFLDDDMDCAPDILDRHAEVFAAGADAVLGAIPLAPGSLRGLTSDVYDAQARERMGRLEQGGDPALFDLMSGHISVRRKIFRELGGFDEGFTADGGYGQEDLDLGLRLLARHTVRHAPLAIARQVYTVTPAQKLSRFRKVGYAAVRFAAKHPQFAQAFFAPHGPDAIRTRYIYRPLAHVPGASAAISALVGICADRLYGHAPRLDRALQRLFATAIALQFWAGVEDAQRRRGRRAAPTLGE